MTTKSKTVRKYRITVYRPDGTIEVHDIEHHIGYDKLEKLIGGYPQLVNTRWFAKLHLLGTQVYADEEGQIKRLQRNDIGCTRLGWIGNYTLAGPILVLQTERAYTAHPLPTSVRD